MCHDSDWILNRVCWSYIILKTDFLSDFLFAWNQTYSLWVNSSNHFHYYVRLCIDWIYFSSGDGVILILPAMVIDFSPVWSLCESFFHHISNNNLLLLLELLYLLLAGSLGQINMSHLYCICICECFLQEVCSVLVLHFTSSVWNSTFLCENWEHLNFLFQSDRWKHVNTNMWEPIWWQKQNK